MYNILEQIIFRQLMIFSSMRTDAHNAVHQEKDMPKKLVISGVWRMMAVIFLFTS